MNMELAFCARDAGTVSVDQLRVKTRNAPQWWLERAGLLALHKSASGSAAAPPRRSERPATPPPARRFSGWVSGLCNPALSVETFARCDGERRREQFTPKAWEGVLAAIRSGKTPVRLTYDHGGITLASTPLDLTFRANALLGLCFDARLPDTAAARQVLAEIGAEGLGVSIGYAAKRWWHVDREGVGKVRVIDEAILDHVAILPRSKVEGPAYEGARCFCSVGNRLGPSREAQVRAEQHAFAVWKRQMGCRP